MKRIVILLVVALVMVTTVSALTVVPSTSHPVSTFDGLSYIGNNVGIVRNMNGMPPGFGIGQKVHVFDSLSCAVDSLKGGEVDFLLLP
ncbi:MAG: hypothetical protein WC472_03955 [Candidatus Paceibacterota bacterium]